MMFYLLRKAGTCCWRAPKRAVQHFFSGHYIKHFALPLCFSLTVIFTPVLFIFCRLNWSNITEWIVLICHYSASINLFRAFWAITCDPFWLSISILYLFSLLTHSVYWQSSQNLQVIVPARFIALKASIQPLEPMKMLSVRTVNSMWIADWQFC